MHVIIHRGHELLRPLKAWLERNLHKIYSTDHNFGDICLKTLKLGTHLKLDGLNSMFRVQPEGPNPSSKMGNIK